MQSLLATQRLAAQPCHRSICQIATAFAPCPVRYNAPSPAQRPVAVAAKKKSYDDEDEEDWSDAKRSKAKKDKGKKWQKNSQDSDDEEEVVQEWIAEGGVVPSLATSEAESAGQQGGAMMSQAAGGPMASTPGLASAQQGYSDRPRYGDGGRGGGRGAGNYGDGPFVQGRGRGRGDGRGEGRGGDGGRGGQMRGSMYASRMSPEQLAARMSVNNTIREAITWQVLYSLLQNQSDLIDAENIVQIMFRISRMEKPTAETDRTAFEQFVASLFGYLAQYVPTLRPRQISMALYSIAKLEYFNQEVVSGLVERAVSTLGNFAEREYAQMLWGLAHMNYSPGPEWLQQFLFYTERKLPGFNPLELSNVITGLAKFGTVPSAEWTKAFGEAFAAKASSASNLDITNIVFSMASLGLLRGEAAEHEAWLGKLFSDPNLCGTFKALDLTRISWSLTQCTWKPAPAWMSAFTTSFIRQLKFCYPSDIATICYSLAYLRAAPAANGIELLIKRIEANWDRFTADELANTCMALAIWSYRPTEQWIEQLLFTLTPKLSGASADGLGKIVSALPVLSSSPRSSQCVTQAQTLLNAQMVEAGPEP